MDIFLVKIQDIINDFPKKTTNIDDVDYEDSVLNWNGHVTLKTNKTEIQANPLGTLDYYPNLYKEFSSENFDYYGITDKTLCPLCKLDHGDEESIEGFGPAYTKNIKKKLGMSHGNYQKHMHQKLAFS
ncbi:hypothetical protein C1645_805122 [Glomus cerebriforme]|uniref:Uncharacterized protein n=1 Tax=Glomus cerebriforme TaxID=658196 RepID=A0A397SZC6_9GLOM|nr:hypothetical protein C1645_805122 [Glomus cerebriforme]